MVSEIIRDSAAFCGSVMSICWRSTLSQALTWLFQFYYVCIHVLAIQIMRSESSGSAHRKESEIISDGICPKPSVSTNRLEGSHVENRNFVHVFEKWDLARIFNSLDSNKDGMVSANDIQVLLERLGLHYFCDDKMKTMMDLPQRMGFDEFCGYFTSLLEESQYGESLKEEKEELTEAFSVFDKNGDGFIAPSELQEVLLRLGHEEGKELKQCETMMRRFDKNSDGRIDFTEFQNMIFTY